MSNRTIETSQGNRYQIETHKSTFYGKEIDCATISNGNVFLGSATGTTEEEAIGNLLYKHFENYDIVYSFIVI